MDKNVVNQLLQIGYGKRNALFYAHIHEVTQSSKGSQEVFVLQKGQSLDAILPPDDGTPETARAIGDITRLYTQGGEYTRDFVYYYTQYVAPKISISKIETSRIRSLANAIASFLRRR
ncbi:hypothetical protein HYV80_05045 [Candidatus Woesearchaeota archaeon]|nr:hypothetical protein [Candidatus Woesearchaeota archaeon]